MPASDSPRYDVVLSFAGEDRPYANALATELGQIGVTVFYDANEQVEMWGNNLYDQLTRVYRDEARYCVMLVSRYYEARTWTNHERRAAQARALNEDEGYILPVRLDDTPIPGLLETTAYLSMPPETPRSLALAIRQKLGREPRSPMPGSHTTPGGSSEPRVSVAHLPATRSELFGRATELADLDAALTDPKVNIAIVAAWGGTGKSALVNNWLKRTLTQKSTQIRTVYGWSFYSQGTENDTSADAYIESALRWFGGVDCSS